VFPQSTVTRTSRGEDTSPARPQSQKTVSSPAAVENSSPQPAAAGYVENRGPGVEKLLETMKALGMSTSGLSITYSEEAVGYPGGSYMNKQITVSSGGLTEQFSADLTEKSPMVTAYELQRYFGVQPTIGGATGNVRRS